MGLITAETFNKYFTVCILTALNLLNYMDRFTIAGILTVLENSNRNGFKMHHNEHEKVTDLKGGLLQTAFIVSYMLLSPIFGYLGDRYTRKYIITFGIIFWSLFTLAGSFSIDYWMLFASRLFVGIGEASYATIAPTLIADLFPSEKRLRMLAIFYLAMPVGSALGYIVGSSVSGLVYKYSGQLDSWRWALRVTPGLGIIAALLVLFLLREPKRGLADGQRTVNGVRGKDGFKAWLKDVSYILHNLTFIFSTLGFTAMAFTTGALAQWSPLFIQRVSSMINPGHGYGDSFAAIAFGGVTVVAGILGTLCGSELSKFLSRYTRKAEALVCSISLLTAVPFLYISLTVVQYKVIYVSWVTVFLAIFCVCLNWTPVSAMLLYTIIPARRATASAVQILLSHFLGDAISPTIVGGISDGVFGYVGPYQEENTGRAVSLEFALFTTVVVMLLGGASFLVATFTVEADRRAVEVYTAKKNTKVGHQRGESTTSTSVESEETRQLLHEAIQENDIVKIKSS